MRRDEDHGSPGDAGGTTRQPHAVHAWHPEIAHDEIEWSLRGTSGPLPRSRLRTRPARGGRAGPFQARLIVDDQTRLRIARVLEWRPTVARPRPSVPVLTADAILTSHRDPARAVSARALQWSTHADPPSLTSRSHGRLVARVRSSPRRRRTGADFTLRDLGNKEVSLSDYKGKVVLVNFWATWCGPCKVEMPHLDKMDAEFESRGFEVLSISTDDARAASMVKPFIKKNGYQFTVLLDKTTAVVSKYNPAKTLPYTAIIDRDGRIAHVHMGYNPGDEKKMREEILALLGPEDAAVEGT